MRSIASMSWLLLLGACAPQDHEGTAPSSSAPSGPTPPVPPTSSVRPRSPTATPPSIEGVPDRCAGAGTSVVVHVEDRRLYHCEKGRAVDSFAITLGRGGVDKRREGDQRTPSGDYALLGPRASSSFHRFIPVGYPTPAQRRRGFTGSAIGIHGPPRGMPAFLSPVLAWDWTEGCIAVASDQEIDRIADWVASRRVRRISIR